MSCCGKKRELFQTAAPQGLASSASRTAVHHPAQMRIGKVIFEYTGRTAMTVIGPATGRRYRFERAGARLEVDLRDRAALAQVLNLRQLPAR